MTPASTTRRALLRGGGIAAAAVAMPASASMFTSEVETAFGRWKSLRRAVSASSEEYADTHPVWADLDAVEERILDAEEAGSRVAEIRLWVGLAWSSLTTKEEAAILREDIGWFLDRSHDLDPMEYRTVYAIKALRGEAR